MQYPIQQPWSIRKKIVFRFFFIYFTLMIAPWSWLGFIPGFDLLMGYYYQADSWLVNLANDYIFNIRPVLVPLNGSGDTSYAYTQLCLYLSLSAMGCLIWMIADKRASHNQLDYWFRTFVRYYVAMVAMIYGSIKLFALQMPFPGLSQLATPLGDLLPMRFSWMFLGYSTPYQFFAGAMEVVVCVLLLNRRTVTTGLLMGAAVFTQVLIMNLCFDIPVKLYSLHLLLYCLFLLFYDAPRLFQLFILNKSVAPTNLYEISFSNRWMRYTRISLKILFIVLYAIMPIYESYSRYEAINSTPTPKPFFGVYQVDSFVLNGDTLPDVPSDTLRWREIIFDKGGSGSVNAQDTLFRQRYRRGYFNYTADTVNQTIGLKKFQTDTTLLCTLAYKISGESIQLKTKWKNDSLRVTMHKTNRHFQLAERQFHWLSEYNR